MQKISFILCFLFATICFFFCEAHDSFLSSISNPCIQGVNILTGQKDQSGLILYEQYQEGINQLGEESFILEKGDFRIGRVKTIQQSRSCAVEIHLFYEPGMTTVCEGLEKKSVYHYSEGELLYLVEYYRFESGNWNLHQRERLFWQGNEDSLRLLSRSLENERDETTLCYCFFYNEQGKLTEEKLVGNLSGECQLPFQMGRDGYPEMNGIESYGIKYVYSEEDQDLLVSKIEENGLKITYQYNTSKQCTAIFREHQEKQISRCFYFYNDQGFLQKMILDDGQTNDPDDLSGVTQQQITRLKIGNQSLLVGKPLKIEHVLLDVNSSKEEIVDEIFFKYDERGELISTVNSQGEVIARTEIPLDLLPRNESLSFPLVDMISFDQIWEKMSDIFYSCFRYLQLSAHQTKLKWKIELNLPEPFGQALEKIAKALFGEPAYLLMGPHFEETYVDCYGQREISDKVRVTFINGILNTRAMMHESLDMISESHGGVKVHYVFRPTEGWTWDISRAAIIKTGFSLFGFRSLHSHLLAKLWKELIEEMGGIEAGGVIVHYAHSLGGAETDRARDLLSPEEQKMIRVVTFGSPTMVRDEGFQSVINIVSVNDGVSSFFLEPFGNLRNYFDPKSNIRFYGSKWQAPYWPTDHLLNGATYGPLIVELGGRFLEEFLPKIDENYNAKVENEEQTSILADEENL